MSSAEKSALETLISVFTMLVISEWTSFFNISWIFRNARKLINQWKSSSRVTEEKKS